MKEESNMTLICTKGGIYGKSFLMSKLEHNLNLPFILHCKTEKVLLFWKFIQLHGIPLIVVEPLLRVFLGLQLDIDNIY